MSYVKNYNVGQTKLDLPYANYIHELPLLSFGDVQHTINLSIVFNYARKAAGDNPFNIASGFKLNMQKKLIISGDSISYQEESGKIINLTAFGDVYTFNDDSQRILRRTEMLVAPPIGGGGSIIGGSITPGLTVTQYEYTVEYPDYSKEEYESGGYITGIYDKYGTKFLSFTYSGTKLTDITYRNTKNIDLEYNSSNQLTSITYASKTINFVYGTNLVTVKHFSGVDYHFNTSGNNLVVHSANAGASYSTTYSHRTTCTKTASALAVKKEIGSKTVDNTTYDFLKVNGDKVVVLDVTNKDGVKTRAQFKDDELLYSYEVGLDNDGFVNNRYIGNVQINNVLNNNRDIHTNGVQKSTDGASISVGATTPLGTNNAYENIYILSGWIKLAQDNGSDTIDLTVANSSISSGTTLHLPTPPVGNWTYFAIAFPWNQSLMCVRINGVETKDFRLSCQIDTTEPSNDDHIAYVGDVLIVEGTNGDNRCYSPVRDDCKIYNGSTLINDTFTVRDILQYKINQMYGTHKNIIFYDNCKKAITSAGDLYVHYTDNGTTHTVSAKNLAVGKLSYINGKEYLTKTNFYLDKENNYHLITKSTINGALYEEDVYNSNLDIVSSTVDDATVHYDYNSNGLIVRQITAPKSLSKEEALANATRADVMIKEYSYNEAEGKTTFIDEFGNSTVYEIDSMWGVVSKITLPDGTVITDNYDDDKCALVSRQFSNATNPRKTTFSYTNGNLAGVSHTDNTDSIAFAFTHDKDKLVNIKKGSNTIEEHEHTDTTQDSYYPTKTGTLHSILSDFDKYGRLTKTDGIVENVYDVMPEYDSNGDLAAKGANGSAILATSKDLTNNQLSKYHYNKGRLESIETENSSGTVISEETFDYDDIGRLTTDTCVYDKANSKSIKTKILYETEVDDPLADNRANRFSHYLNDSTSPIAQTGYDFDEFNRIKTKFCSINGSEFTKNITYTKTRPTRLFEMLSGRPLRTTDYTYDNRGRIATVTSDGTTMQYTYDAYGQLVQEKDVSLDKTIQYVYNGIGNIKSVSTTYSSGTPSTQTFTYGDSANPDRLTSYNGKAITYNTMGCPTSYDGKNFMWYDGKLSSVSKGSGLGRAIISNRENYFYTYNAKGQRTHKNYSYLPADLSATYYYTRSINTEYAYDNAGRLIKERRTYTYSDNTSYSIEFMFLYDESGIVGVQFKDGNAAAQAYYYQKNLQGDVIAIYDTAGAVQAKYKYDAFGNCTVTNSTNSHLANYNPIRYRGYYWDSETNWYFLNARYYSPEWRRFISPDDTTYLNPKNVNGLNLYCYCNNNPIMYVDPLGTSSRWNILGFSVNAGKEQTLSYLYLLICSIETGAGYSKSFDNENLFNFFAELPENPLQFWEYSFGLSIKNKKGVGVSISAGTESSIAFHGQTDSIELYVNTAFRLGLQYAYETSHGEYAYTKYEINLPELVVVAVLTAYALEYLSYVGEAVGALGAALLML